MKFEIGTSGMLNIYDITSYLFLEVKYFLKFKLLTKFSKKVEDSIKQ